MTVCSTCEAHLQYILVYSTRNSTDLSCIRVLHTRTGIVGVLEMGMKVCLRGIALEFHLYADMSILL